MAVEDGNYLVTVACPGSSPLDGDQFNRLVSTSSHRQSPRPSPAVGRWVRWVPQGPRGFGDAALIAHADLPLGVVALGGSVCSFDPLYGQDFEAAVLEAALGTNPRRSTSVRKWSQSDRAAAAIFPRGDPDPGWRSAIRGPRR